MSNRYTAKVAESLKLRGWIDEIQAKSLRSECDRLNIELKEAKCATDFANLACDRKDEEIVRLKGEVESLEKRNAGHWVSADNHLRVVVELATYKAAVVEAREALELGQKWLCNCVPTCEIWGPKPLPKIAKSLHALSALTGDATKPT